MLFVTWNVNSLNARMHRVLPFLDQYTPDVVLLQETKASDANYPHLELEAAGYQSFTHSTGGRNGVAILVHDNHDASDPSFELPGTPVPDEGRWVEVTVDGTRCISTYVINGRSPDHPVFKDKLTFLERAADRVAELGDQPIALAGDFNIAPTDDDVWDLDEFGRDNTHITDDERSRLDRIKSHGLVDAYEVATERHDNRFTWFDYRGGSFHKNKGLRIDLVLLSKSLGERVDWAGMDREYRKGEKPSDHAPLLARLAD